MHRRAAGVQAEPAALLVSGLAEAAEARRGAQELLRSAQARTGGQERAVARLRRSAGLLAAQGHARTA